MKFILLPFIIVGGLLAVFGLLYILINRQGRKARGELERTFGPRIRLISGCGVISGLNRVPGVLALLDDRIVYRTLVTGATGEIPLDEIESFSIEDTRKSRHRRARKYRNASVLALAAPAGETPLFALKKSDAPKWQTLLRDVPVSHFQTQ